MLFNLDPLVLSLPGQKGLPRGQNWVHCSHDESKSAQLQFVVS